MKTYPVSPASLKDRTVGYGPTNRRSNRLLETLCRCSTEVVQPLGKRKIAGSNPAFGSHGPEIDSTGIGCIKNTGRRNTLRSKQKETTTISIIANYRLLDSASRQNSILPRGKYLRFIESLARADFLLTANKSKWW